MVPWAMGDEARLIQVVDGIRSRTRSALRIRRARPHSAGHQSTSVCLAVRDTGIGPDQYQPDHDQLG